jgi:hypothetical protein
MHPCQVLTADIRAQVGFVKAFSAEDISRRPLAMTPSESMKGMAENVVATSAHICTTY